MADNVVYQSGTPATPPDLTVVSTEEVTTLNGAGVTAQQIQRVAAAVRTADGVAIDLPATLADGLLVNLGANNDVTVLGTVQLHGTGQQLGTYQPLAGSVHLASRLPGTVDIGTIAGTVSVLGTIQPLAGSVHIASALAGGTVSIAGSIWGGTFSLAGGTAHIGSVQRIAGTVDIGTIAGTVSALGTIQPLAGSVHLATNLAGGTVVSVGSAAHGAAADSRPHLIGAFGSSGTQAAVADGQATRLWADLNGRLQIRGTIDSIPAITITAGTISLSTGGTMHIGSVQRIAGTVDIGTIAGTVSILGTTQPLAGSVHLATNLAGGTVVAVGSAVHDAVADTRPHLIGAFGSSGTQAAVNDGDATRLWADLNGRLQIRGTIDSIPAIVITSGTVSLQTGGTMHIGTVQRLAGGTIDSLLGTVHIGSVQRIAGTVDIGTIAGTVQGLGTHSVAGSVFGGTFHKPPIAAITDGTIDGTIGNVTLLATNASRQGAAIFNDPRGAGGNLFVRLGASAGTLRYNVKIAPNGYYELPMRYTGAVNGIWDIAGGTAQLSEW